MAATEGVMDGDTSSLEGQAGPKQGKELAFDPEWEAVFEAGCWQCGQEE